MMNQCQIKSCLWILLLLNLAACNNANPEKVVPEKKDTTVTVEKKEVFPAWQDSLANTDKGIIGIYEVPEMMALCKLDSAPMKNVAPKIIQNFLLLDNDLHRIGSDMGDYQGIIYYNNNPENFKFECFLLIKKIPNKKPKQAQLVVLESAKMLIYNHYGAFENIYKAYAEIKQYCKDNKLLQIGQMREFYPISQSNETDVEKRLTRIMVPVVREIKKTK